MDGFRATRTRLVVQPGESLGREPVTPLATANTIRARCTRQVGIVLDRIDDSKISLY